MPYPIDQTEERLDNSSVTTEMAWLSLRTEELSLSLEKMTLENSMTVAQLQREQEAEIRRHREEIEKLRMQFEEDRRVREHDEEMKRLEMEANNKAREHELKPEVQETLRLKLELAKLSENIEKLKNEDNRRIREHKEKMAAFEVERLNRCEELERQRRRDEKQDIRSLRNLGLVASGVGTASGAIGGALGTTAAIGLAAGVAGAATVMAPVAGTVAVLSGAGYVYKKVMSSNRA